MSEAALQAEIARLNKIIHALMNRAERSENVQGSDFNLFHTAVLLEEQVRNRTEELRGALAENERMTRALRESEAKFRALVDQSLVGFSLYDGKRFVYVNPRFAGMLGYSIDELMMMGAHDITPPEDRPEVDALIERALARQVVPETFRANAVRKDGSIMNAEISGAVIEIGGQAHLLSIWNDITERLRNEREVVALTMQLKEMAIRDPLTGLYNRRYLNDALERELALAKRKGYPVSFMMGDIDYFKRINDGYGHPAGDEVLKVFSNSLLRHSRLSDICCRYGGEEFLLVMPDVPEALACERAEAMCSAIRDTSIKAGSSILHITASFGVATFPQYGADAPAMISAADAALYEAKASGRNCVRCYSSPHAAQG